MPEFAWRDSEKWLKPSRIAGIRAEIWTEDLLYTKQEWYPLEGKLCTVSEKVGRG
jgi:hypothetical protein